MKPAATDPTVIYTRLNKLISEFPHVLIEQKDGRTYHLKEHWRYVNPYREAPRVLLSRGQISTNQFEYLTHPFKIVTSFKRTR